VGPLASPKIIDLLNTSFVPVFAVVEDYEPGGAFSEHRELLRSIWADAAKKKLPAGVVHVYLLDANSSVLNSQHVRDAMQTPKLARFLETNLAALGTTPGKTLGTPRKHSGAPKVAADEVLLHMQSEYVQFRKVVAEDWVVLKPAEWKQFVAVDGQLEWTLDSELAKKILVPVYPFAVGWNAGVERVVEAELKLFQPNPKNDPKLVGIRGHVWMQQLPAKAATETARSEAASSETAKPKTVKAELVGTARVGANGKPEILLTTHRAEFDSHRFDTLIQSETSKAK
jgi:hypothetical protein